jgi:hypothetical protein
MSSGIVNPLVNQVPVNSNAVIDMLKFKVLSDLIGSSNEMSITTMLITFVCVLLFDKIKDIGDFIIIKTKYVLNYFCSENKISSFDEFKYTLKINNSTYSSIIDHHLADLKFKNVNHASINKSKRSSAYEYYKYDLLIEDHIWLVIKNTFYPLKKIKMNEYIYVTRKEEIEYLVCNTCMQDMLDFIEEITKKYGKLFNGKIACCNMNDNKSLWLNSYKTFDNIFFEQKEHILNLIELFQNKEWYKSRGIPRQLNLLLTGPPGTGKTSFIKAFAKHMNRNLVSVDMATITTKTQFSKFFEYEKSIVIMEDFDRVPCVLTSEHYIKQHDNKKVGSKSNNILLDKLYTTYLKADEKTKEDALNIYKKELENINKLEENNDDLDLAYILNKFDGIIENDNKIFIFTCNHPERLDKALLRPGRIDLVINFKKANKQIIAQIIKHFYNLNDFPNVKGIIEYKYSPAEIIAMCKKYYNNYKEVIKQLKNGIETIESNII